MERNGDREEDEDRTSLKGREKEGNKKDCTTSSARKAVKGEKKGWKKIDDEDAGKCWI